MASTQQKYCFILLYASSRDGSHQGRKYTHDGDGHGTLTALWKARFRMKFLFELLDGIHDSVLRKQERPPFILGELLPMAQERTTSPLRSLSVLGT